jgi:hypothetical protein
MCGIESVEAFDPSQAAWQSQGQHSRNTAGTTVYSAGSAELGGSDFSLSLPFFSTFVILNVAVDGAILNGDFLCSWRNPRQGVARLVATRTIAMATRFGRFENRD